MIYYYKVNEAVVRKLGLTEVRKRLQDGNYIIWFLDMKSLMMELGSDSFDELKAQVGALSLTPLEAKQEQDGKVMRNMPEPTLPEFVMNATGETQYTETEPEDVETAPEPVADAEQNTEVVTE
jgi:hypothetical protein